MFVEIHILQNFAPSCLNRDESNSPKDCFFGDQRRARISSQCIKHAMRSQSFPRLLKSENLGNRTLNLFSLIKERFLESKKDEKESEIVAKNFITEILGIKIDDEGKTSVLLFLGNDEINIFSKIALDYWDVLRKDKIDKKDKLVKELTEKVRGVFDGQKAADVALFGRMIAEIKDHNVDAACQVAHAFSTNRMNLEFDFYTALDEAKFDSKQGAGMMGTIEFNSACFYRYANIDTNQLLENLQNDKVLAKNTILAFINASVDAIPTGKQNSMAAQNPPSFIFIVLRKSKLWSLANAFEKPIRGSEESGKGLIESSISALTSYWVKLTNLYGNEDIVELALISDGGELNTLEKAKKANIKELIKTIEAAIRFGDD